MRTARTSLLGLLSLGLGWAACATTLADTSRVEWLPGYRGAELPAGVLKLAPIGLVALDVTSERGADSLYYDALAHRLPDRLRSASRFDEVRWAETLASPLEPRTLRLGKERLTFSLPRDGEGAQPSGPPGRWVLFLAEIRLSTTATTGGAQGLEERVRWALWDEEEHRLAAYGQAEIRGELDWSARLFEAGEREADIAGLINGLAVELMRTSPFFPGQRL